MRCKYFVIPCTLSHIHIQSPNDSSKWFRSTGAHSQFAMAIHFQISRRINEVLWKAFRILSGNIHSDRVLRANNVERNYSSKQGMVVVEFFRLEMHGFEFCEKKKANWKKWFFFCLDYFYVIDGLWPSRTFLKDFCSIFSLFEPFLMH